MWFAAAAAIIATGISMYGQFSAANAQEEAASRNAALKKRQADELLFRQAANEEIMREKAGEFASNYQAEAGSTGFANAGISGMIKIKRRMEENIISSRREAEWKATMLRAGADADTDLASDVSAAAKWTGAGTLIGAAGTTYSMWDKYDKPSGKAKSLPKADS